MTPDGHHRAAVPRHRGIDSRRGRMERCAALVPEAGVSSVTPGQTGHDGGGAPSQTPPVEAALRPALEAVERVCECREASRHGNADLPSAADPAAPKEKGESKGKGKKQRRASEEGTLRMNSNNDSGQSQQTGCEQLWEDVELTRWAMASVASARSQIKSLVLPLLQRSTVSW